MILTSQQFNDAYGKLPFPIREFLASDEPGKITSEIGVRYNLHVDTVGAIDREVSNMLLGLINPEQFVTELKAAGITGENVGVITHELNEKIFVPLREKMRRLSEEPSEQNADPDVEKAAANLDLAPNTPPKFQPPAAIPYVPPVSPILAAVPSYTAPAVAPQSATMPRIEAAPQRVELSAPAQFPELRTMASDMAAVKSGEVPHSFSAPTSVWEPAPAVAHQPQSVYVPPPAPIVPPIPPQYQAIPAISAPAPASVPAPTPQPAYVAPVMSEPSITPVGSTAPAGSTVLPTKQAPVNENRDALHAVLKSYGIDPYREPPE